MAGSQTSLSLQDKMSGPLMKIISVMDKTIRNMDKMNAAAKIDTQHIEKASNSVQALGNEMERQMNSAKNGANGAAGGQQKLNNEIRAGTMDMKSFGVAILSAVGAYKAIGAAKNFLGGILKQGMDFHAFKQASEVAFTTFLGDAQTAKQYMADMLAFAQTTPFAYPDLLESSRNLIAFGIEAKNTFPIMQAIGDAVAAVGGGNAEMKNMADIFGQIQSQGRITAMEVNRLGQYGVNAFEILGDASGKTAAQMRKEISKGSVDAGTAITALVAGMDKKFGGLMKGVKGTWVGAIDSMKSASRNAGAALMEGFMKAEGPLVKLVGNITGIIKKIPLYLGPAIAAFLPLIETLNNALDAGAFDAFLSTVGAGLSALAWIVSGLGMVVINVAQFFNDHWNFIAPLLFSIASAVAALTFSVLAIKTATMGWAVWQWAVNAAYIANPITWILLVIVAAIALIVYALYEWADASAAVIGLFIGGMFLVGSVFYNVLMTMGNIALTVAELFANVWSQAIYLVHMSFIVLNLAIRVILDAIGNTVLRVAEFFVNTWNDGVFSVQLAFKAMATFILTIMSGVASGVVGVVNKALDAVSALINGAVSGINSFISLLNGVLGTDLSTIGTVDLKMGNGASSFLDGLKADIATPVRAERANFGNFDSAGAYANGMSIPSAPSKVDLGRLDYKNPIEEFAKGTMIGVKGTQAASDKIKGVADKITGLADGLNKLSNMTPGTVPTNGYEMGDPSKALGDAGKKKKPKNPTGGKLDKVGKIEKPINIADEDLKMLRDLAEIKAIQNTITLTPSVNFTGDMAVRKEEDIRKIVRQIEAYLEGELANNIEGAILT